MNKHSTSAEATGSVDGPYPVLARLPDVTEQLAREASSKRAAAAGFVSYRVDPPQHSESSARKSAAPVDSAREGKPAIMSPARPHMAGQGRGRGAPGESPILPRSNPFAIPSSTLQDTLAPVIRFLVLFALFTAAGTWFLTSTRPAESDREISEPQTTVAQPTLTPQPLNPADNVIESSAVLPTAAGPLGTKAPRTGWRNQNRKKTTRPNPQSSVGPSTSASRVAGLDWELPPDDPSSELPQDVHEGESAGPPAIARLPGYILASPAKQAHHGYDESSLH